MLVEPGAEGVRFEPVPAELTNEQEDLSRDYLVLLDPAGESLDMSAYWGVKDYDRLADVLAALARS